MSVDSDLKLDPICYTVSMKRDESYFTVKFCGNRHASCSICKPEINAKISEKAKTRGGRQQSQEEIAKRAQTQTGKKFSQTRKENISTALKAITFVYEVKNCGNAHASCKICRPEIITKEKWPLEKLLCYDDSVGGGRWSKVKGRLIELKLLPYECVWCGLKNEWNSKPLVLQLDHIDGDRRNNVLGNLRLLCPNCHTQTATFSSRKVPKVSFREISLKSCGNRHYSCKICQPKTKSAEELLASAGSNRIRGGLLKKKLLEEEFWKNICSVCGGDDLWRDESLTLQVDHINGNYKNNTIDNFRLLCPNCHSQTETYCRRFKDRK